MKPLQPSLSVQVGMKVALRVKYPEPSMIFWTSLTAIPNRKPNKLQLSTFDIFLLFIAQGLELATTPC
jgi:hypothetical protein